MERGQGGRASGLVTAGGRDGPGAPGALTRPLSGRPIGSGAAGALLPDDRPRPWRGRGDAPTAWRRGHPPSAIPSTGGARRVPDDMDDAGLQRSPRESRRDRVGGGLQRTGPSTMPADVADRHAGRIATILPSMPSIRVRPSASRQARRPAAPGAPPRSGRGYGLDVLPGGEANRSGAVARVDPEAIARRIARRRPRGRGSGASSPRRGPCDGPLRLAAGAEGGPGARGGRRAARSQAGSSTDRVRSSGT